MYDWLRRGLFFLPPETAHDLALNALAAGRLVGLPRFLAGCPVADPFESMGLEFPNRIGLAAGLDKNGDFIDTLGSLGFGFIEVGTVTPHPQPGNPAPRMFRLPEHEALINRLGFNNKGVNHLVGRLKSRRFEGIVGANIGKQKETPLDQAAGDYRTCLEKVHTHCDYVTVNISSPNTADLRALQDTGPLAELLAELAGCRRQLESRDGVRRPMLVKIAPDFTENSLTATLETIASADVDGLIATNTTTDREPVAGHRHAGETGGLSGGPLRLAADRVLARARTVLGPEFPLVGLGGITRPEHALAKLDHGADLVQIYTGFIYHGPALVREAAIMLRDHGR